MLQMDYMVCIKVAKKLVETYTKYTRKSLTRYEWNGIIRTIEKFGGRGELALKVPETGWII